MKTKVKKNEQKLLKVLVKRELALISSLDNPKHKAIVNLLMSTGLRVSEFLSLNISDVCSDSTITIKHAITIVGKGGKTRTIPLSPLAKESIFVLIKDSQSILKGCFDLNSPLCVSEKRKRMCRMQVFRIMKGIEEKLDIEIKISPHTFRHQFATNLIQKGCNLKDVQTLLGHAKISTTMDIYSHSTRESLENAIRLLD